MNVGVILFCRTRRYLAAAIELDPARLAAFAPDLDPADLQPHLDSLVSIAAGGPDSGPIGALPQTERFHWLTSPRSTIIQPSPVHTGRCPDPAAALEHLMATMVRVKRET
jgi:hypothetical protein